MKTLKKATILKLAVSVLIIMPPAAYIANWSYNHFIYLPPFSVRFEWLLPAYRYDPNIRDIHRNAGIVDFQHNMILVLTLPDINESVSWFITNRTKTSADFYSAYGHVVESHLRKNSFVVMDGVTGEELIIHPVTTREVEQWNNEFLGFERHYSPEANLVEECFKFFSIPEETFLEIQEKVNQHDTSNERNPPGDGFVGNGDEVEVFGSLRETIELQRKKNQMKETNKSTD